MVQAQNKALDWLCKRLPPHVSILIGAITENKKSYGKAFHNSALLIGLHQTPLTFSKQLLPTYDVFDEARHIEPGCLRDNIFKWNNQNILVTICEDIWGQRQQGTRTIYKEDPIQNISPNQVDLIVNLGASPFTTNKTNDRLNMAQKTVRHLKAPLLYVNLVGGQDELIFDGGSFILNAQGELINQSPYFEESLQIYEDKVKKPLPPLSDGFLSEKPKLKKPTKSDTLTTPNDSIERLHRALVLGIKDFVRKTGFQRVHLGLSGGIDSALVACLAVDALGPQNVSTIAMPSPFNSENSLKWAKSLAHNLNVKFEKLPISETYEVALKNYETTFGSLEFGLVHENMQSRLRNLFLMAYSNHHSSLLLNTSNKSEMAVGYSTLYGDMSGALSPIGDLLKRDVYSLSQFYNPKESGDSLGNH